MCTSYTSLCICWGTTSTQKGCFWRTPKCEMWFVLTTMQNQLRGCYRNLVFTWLIHPFSLKVQTLLHEVFSQISKAPCDMSLLLSMIIYFFFTDRFRSFLGNLLCFPVYWRIVEITLPFPGNLMEGGCGMKEPHLCPTEVSGPAESCPKERDWDIPPALIDSALC